MAKNSISLADLNEALKPLIEAIKVMQQESTASSARVDELHQEVLVISKKLDVLSVSSGDSSATIRAANRKLIGRKGGAKKTPVKKAKGKKAASDAEAEEAEEPDAAEEESEEPKKPVKKAVTKAKKVVKKDPTAVKKPVFNKMIYFKKQFEEDETQFAKVFTPKIKKEIESTDDAKKLMADKTGDALKKARANLYYHYLKDNNTAVLDELRAKFDQENGGASEANADADDADADADAEEADENAE